MGRRRSPLGLSMGLLVWLDLWGTAAVTLEPIYWTAGNTRFQAAGGYVVYPQIGDRLDLICPRARPPGPVAGEGDEYYKLYLVPGEEARACEVGRVPDLLLTCDRPSHDVRFTIKFQEFSPNLWGHEFKSRQDYYIITTSDGTKEGLENLKGGACVSKGMKVVLKVGQHPGTGSTSQKSGPQTPPETGRGTPGGADPSKESGAGNATGPAGGADGPLPPSRAPVVAGAAGGAAVLALLAAGAAGAVGWRRRRAKPSDPQAPPLSLRGLRGPQRGGGGSPKGAEPSDIIVPLRPSDGGFCPHYEKVSGDYGHPVYIVQEMPPQSPPNIYYKV